MRAIVHFTNSERTRCAITLVPSWLSRMFGARPRTGDAERVLSSWVWSTTHRHITHDDHAALLLRELEAQSTQPLPRAALESGK